MLTFHPKYLAGILLVMITSSTYALNLTEAKHQASILGKNIFINYSAGWCLPCQLFEEQTLSDKTVSDLLEKQFVFINADFDNSQDKEIFEAYEVQCLPTLHVLDDQGEVLLELNGLISKTELLENLKPFHKSPEIEIENELENSYSTSVVSRMNNINLSETSYFYTIQLGAFKSLPNAESYSLSMSNRINEKVRIVHDPIRDLYLINVGRFNFKNEYTELIRKLRETNIEFFIKSSK